MKHYLHHLIEKRIIFNQKRLENIIKIIIIRYLFYNYIKMKTIDLKGKKYAQVSERIREVHKENKNISIETDILWIGEKGGFQVKATIKTDK